jgi:site-specific DNA-methyltransferase (cytosine-N4-specific)
MGDAYCGSGLSGGTTAADTTGTLVHRGAIGSGRIQSAGLKPKDLIGQPWMLAFALRADGWYLRQDIIWAKPNPMPESVGDRCTKSHEYLFLLSKSERYYFDAEAIKEPVTGNSHPRGSGVNPKAAAKVPANWNTSAGNGEHGNFHREGREIGKIPGVNSRMNCAKNVGGRPPQPRQNESFSAAVRGLVDTRNKRSVWTVATFPCKEAHFATYPPALITPCILAGSRPGDTILDPFGGSGTTGMVAIEHGRRAVLIELNPDYIPLIERRTSVTKGLAL